MPKLVPLVADDIPAFDVQHEVSFSPWFEDLFLAFRDRSCLDISAGATLDFHWENQNCSWWECSAMWKDCCTGCTETPFLENGALWSSPCDVAHQLWEVCFAPSWISCEKAGQNSAPWHCQSCDFKVIQLKHRDMAQWFLDVWRQVKLYAHTHIHSRPRTISSSLGNWHCYYIETSEQASWVASRPVICSIRFDYGQMFLETLLASGQQWIGFTWSADYQLGTWQLETHPLPESSMIKVPNLATRWIAWISPQTIYHKQSCG